MIASALRYRVTLSGDRIEVIRPLDRRRMLREDIYGWRLQRNQYCATLELVPQDRKADSIWIPLVFKTDDTWREARRHGLRVYETRRASNSVVQGRPLPGSARMNGMKKRIRRLSWKTELTIVLTLAFGWTLPGTLRALLTPEALAQRSTPPITNIGIWSVVLLELLLLAILVPFLRARGWTLARLGIRPSWRGSLQGLGLAFAAYALYFLFAVVVVSVWPAVAGALSQTHLVGKDLSWAGVVFASTINPLYEELFVCGYLISVLTEPRPGAVVAPVRIAAAGEVESTGPEALRTPTSTPAPAVSMATAVNISAALRLSYHLYQGVAGVLALVPTGLLFAVWFVRTRQLWPLIVAHAMMDLVGLCVGTG